MTPTDKASIERLKQIETSLLRVIQTNNTYSGLKALKDFLNDRPRLIGFPSNSQLAETFAPKVDAILRNCCCPVRSHDKMDQALKILAITGPLGTAWQEIVAELNTNPTARIEYPHPDRRVDWGDKSNTRLWDAYGECLLNLKTFTAVAMTSTDVIPTWVCEREVSLGGGDVVIRAYDGKGTERTRARLFEGTTLLGFTGEVFSNVAMGPHDYVARLDGFLEQSVHVEVNSTNRLERKLVLTPKPVVLWIGTTPTDCRVVTIQSDGQRQSNVVSASELSHLELPEGNYQLHFEKENYRATNLVLEVHPEMEKRIQVVLQPLPGQVQIIVSANGQRIAARILDSDGRMLGQAGEIIKDVDAGHRRFQVEFPSYRPEPVVLQIEPNSLAIKTVELTTVPELLQKPLADELVEKIKDIQLVGVNMSDPRTCRTDVEGRSASMASLLQDPKYAEVQHQTVVIEAQLDFWKKIATQSCRKPVDWSFLAIARGAIWAGVQRSPGTNWWGLASSWGLADQLPIPQMEGWQAGGETNRNPYLELLSTNSSAGLSVLPHFLTVHCQASQRHEGSDTLKMVLVPDGPGIVSGSSWSLKQPLYMAASETPVAAMRCFYDEWNRKPELKNIAFFAGFPRQWTLPGEKMFPYRDLNPADQIYSFCNWLSQRNGLQPVYTRKPDKRWTYDRKSYGFRLPTEMEWEYAARYGLDFNTQASRGNWGAVRSKLEAGLNGIVPKADGEFVYFYMKSEPRRVDGPTAELYPLGMRDMCGNAGELCMTDVEGEETVLLQVRGGNHKSRLASEVMPESREEYSERYKTPVGFRVVLPMPVDNFNR